MSGWKPIGTAPEHKVGRPILCRNENHWPEICSIKNGMAFDSRGYAMVGYVAKEWFEPAGELNWFNIEMPDVTAPPTPRTRNEAGD